MSEPAVKQVQLPSSEDIRKTNALLREDLTSDVRGEVADRLVLLAAREPHPRAKAAMFERAARLVVDFDAERSVILLRESFRHFPQVEVGQRLAATGDEEPSLQQLGRMSTLYDSVAAITEEADARRDALINAIQYHIERGHGRRAQAAIAKLDDATREEATVGEWLVNAEARLQERQAELAAVRAQLAAASDDERGQILLDYARLLLAGDEPLEQASAALADAVESGADPAVAAPLWASVARSVGEPEMLARALAGSLIHSASMHDRMRVADELVNLPGVDERNPELAQQALETLVEAMPDDAGLRARLLVARSAAGDTEADRQLDQMRLAAVRDRDRSAEAVVCLALARIARRAGNDAKVERYLRRVRTLDPRNGEALDFFESRYRAADDHKRLYLVLTHRLAISQGEELVRVALEMARLAEEQMANHDRAIEAFHRVLAVHPNNRTALDGLERLYRATQRWPALRDLLDRRARTMGSVAEATLETLAEGSLILRALVALHLPDGVLPDEGALLESYQRLHICAPHDPVAADHLIAHYRGEEAWRPLASVLEHRIESTQEPAARAGFARELYDVYLKRLDDAELARVALARVVEDAPDDIASIRLLEASCRSSDDRPGLLAALRRLQSLVEGDDRLALLEEAAMLASEEEDAAVAIELFVGLQQIEPGHMAARRGLTRLYAASGQAALLAELIDLRLADETLDGDERIELLESLVRARTELNEADAAEAAGATLRELDPKSKVGAAAVSRALLSRSDFGELRSMHEGDRAGARAYVEALKERAENLPLAARVRALVAAAEAESSELSDPAAAADLSHAALLLLLEAEDADAELVTEVARNLLEQGEAAADGGLQSLAVATLVERSQDELQRMYMAQRVAICEAEGDPGGAYQAMTALLMARIEAGDLEGIGGAAERLGDLGEQADAEGEVPETLVGFAELLSVDDRQCGQAEAAIELLVQAAEQALLRGTDSAVARKAVDLALQQRSDDIELVRLLERVCSDQGDWQAVVDGLCRQADMLADDERVDTLLRAASLCDGVLGDDGRAEALYRDVISERPGSGEAWAGLLDTLRGRDDRVALAAALDAFITAPVDDLEARSRAALQRIEMLADDDSDGATILAAAAPVLRHVASAEALYESDEVVLAVVAGRLDVAEDALAAAALLLPAVRKHGRHDEVLRCNEVLAETVVKGSDAHIDGLLDMARLAAEQLQQPARAWQQLREAMIAAPHRADVFEAAAGFAAEHQQDDELDSLVCALVDAAEIEGVTAIADADQRHELLRRWATTAMTADRGDAAIQAWGLLHAADSQAVDALEALEALYRQAADGDAVAFVLQERLALDAEPEEAESTWLRLADVHLSDREAPAEAVATLAEAVQALPESASLRAMWLQTLRDHGQAEDLAAALVTAIAATAAAATDDDAEIAEERLLQRELALLYEQKLARPDQALPLWHALLLADVADDEAAEHVFDLLATSAETGLSAAEAKLAAGLDETFDARAEHKRVDALLSARIAAAAPGDRLPLWRQQATLRATAMDAPALAFETLAQVLRQDPADADLIGEMRALAERGADVVAPAQAAAAFSAAASQAEGAQRRALRLHAIECLTREDGDTAQGRTAIYRAMLADDPTDAQALDGLDAVLLDSGDGAARLAVILARIGASTDPETVRGLRLEHAGLALEVGDDEGAIASYGELLQDEDADARAVAVMALVELHERREEHGPLADNLLRMRELSEDGEERLALALRCAELLVKAERPADALATLRQAETEAALDGPLYAAVEARLRAGDDDAALLAHLERGWREVYAADAEQAEARLAAALAHLEAQSAGSPQDRLALLDGVTQAGLQDPAFDAALADLAAQDDDEVAGVALDQQIARWQAQGAHAESVAARLERMDRFPARVSLRQERAELAAIFEAELADPDAALAQFQQVVAADPTDEEAVQAMLRLGEATGQNAECEALLKSAATELADPRARHAILMTSAERAIGRGEHVAAADLFDAILAEDPNNQDAYGLRGAVLDEVAGQDGLARQVAHHEHAIAHASDPEIKRLARMLLANLHHESLDQPVQAFELIAAQLAETPEPEHAADLYRMAEVYAGAASITAPLWELLETEAEGTTDGAAAVALWGALARRCATFQAAHDRARRFAEKSLAHTAGDKTDAVEALAVVHASGKASDPALVDLLVRHLRADQPVRALALLREAAAATADAERRLAYLGEAAELAAAASEEEGVDPVGALIELARAAPAVDANWQRSLEAAGGQTDRVIEALLAAYGEATAVELRQGLLTRAADVSETAGDAETAAAYLRMALEEAEQPELRSRLEAYQEAAGELETLAVDLEDRAERDEEARVELLERALDIWLDRLGDAEHGLMVLDGLLALHPERMDLQDRRLDILRLQNAETWLAAVEEAIDQARSAGDKPRLARLLPRAIEHHLDTAAAPAIHAQITELAGVSDDVDTLCRLSTRLMERLDELEPAAALVNLERVISGTDASGDPGTWMTAHLLQLDLLPDPAQQGAVLALLVTHASERLGDMDLAVEWQARALLLAPTDLTQAKLLVHMTDSPERIETALPALQSCFEAADGEVADLIALAANLIEMAPADAETWRILELRCADPSFCRPAAESLVSVLRVVGAGERAIALQRIALVHAPANERITGLLSLAEDLAGQPDRAAEAVALLLDNAPDVHRPLDFIERAADLAREHDLLGQWLDGVEMLVAGEMLESDASLAAIALAAGTAASELQDANRAAELWTRAWDVDPDSEDARDAVLALRRESENPSQLATDLDRALMQGGGSAAAVLRMELARLCLDALNRPGEALHQARAVLRDAPDNEDALALVNELGSHAAFGAQALELLEELHRGAERWQPLAEVLLKRLAAASGSPTPRQLRELADLQQHRLDQPAEAMDTLLRLLATAPDVALLERFAALARATDSEDDIAGAYEIALDGPLGDQARARVLAAAVQFHSEEAPDPEVVESLLKRLVEVDPTHTASWEALDALYDEGSRWPELIALLRRRAVTQTDADERRMVLHRLGGIAQATEALEAAVEAYEQLADLDADDLDSAQTAVELLRSTNDPGRLVAALDALAGRTADADDKARLICESARLRLERLDDVAGGTELYRQAFELSAAADEAFVFLERHSSDDPRQLMKLYRHRCGGVEAGPARTLILRKLATVCSHMGRGGEARAALEKALLDDPGNPAIDEALLEVCRTHEDYEGFRPAAERRLAQEMPRLERIALLRELMRMAGGHESSAVWIDELRKLVPDDAELGVLQAMHQSRSEDPKQAAEGLEKVVGETTDEAEQVALLERLAALYAGPLDNARKAISSYQRILRVEPRRWEAHRALCDLYAQRQSHEAQAECLRNWLELVDEGSIERVPLLVELSAVLTDLKEQPAALAAYEEAYGIDPSRLDVQEPLALLLAEAGELERAARLQGKVVDGLRRVRRRAEVPQAAIRCGGLLERLDRHEDARRMYRVALSMQPRDITALLGLGRTSLSVGDVDRAMVEFNRVAHNSGRGVDDLDQAQAQLGLGRCWKAQGKQRQARACFSRALELVPALPEALEELESL